MSLIGILYVKVTNKMKISDKLGKYCDEWAMVKMGKGKSSGFSEEMQLPNTH